MFYDSMYLAKGFRMRPKVWSTLNATLQIEETFAYAVNETHGTHWPNVMFY